MRLDSSFSVETGRGRGAHLSLGEGGGVLQHVHDDGEQLVHPLPHLQATHLQAHADQSEHRDVSKGNGKRTAVFCTVLNLIDLNPVLSLAGQWVTLLLCSPDNTS